MSDGWIKLYRELLDKPIWKLSTPEQKTVLITLLLLASHKLKEWEWKGEKFIINHGQLVASLNSIKKAAGNGISVQNIRTALVRFEKLGFLTNKSTKCGRLISIINWDSYQEILSPPNKDSNKGVTKTSQRPNTYQEYKNIRKKEKPKIYSSNFLIFWNAYPRKKNKGSAERAFKKINPDKSFLNEILSKLEEAKKSHDWQKDGGQFIPYPATWLNARGWEDEIKQGEVVEGFGFVPRWDQDPDLDDK